MKNIRFIKTSILEHGLEHLIRMYMAYDTSPDKSIYLELLSDIDSCINKVFDYFYNNKLINYLILDEDAAYVKVNYTGNHFSFYTIDDELILDMELDVIFLFFSNSPEHNYKITVCDISKTVDYLNPNKVSDVYVKTPEHEKIFFKNTLCQNLSNNIKLKNEFNKIDRINHQYFLNYDVSVARIIEDKSIIDYENINYSIDVLTYKFESHLFPINLDNLTYTVFESVFNDYNINSQLELISFFKRLRVIRKQLKSLGIYTVRFDLNSRNNYKHTEDKMLVILYNSNKKPIAAIEVDIHEYTSNILELPLLLINTNTKTEFVLKDYINNKVTVNALIEMIVC